MGNETAKSNLRRRYDPLFGRIFQGQGIDIGASDDNLARQNIFPGITSCESFDKSQGDANEILRYREAASFDFVYSSHCLEHLHNPIKVLSDWLQLVRIGGHVVFVVPDEDLYEQGAWPSRFNGDHKHSFTIWKRREWPSSWCPNSINIVDLLNSVTVPFRVLRIALCDDRYDYSLKQVDQTAMTPGAEANIEVILQRLPSASIMRHAEYGIDHSRVSRHGAIAITMEEIQSFSYALEDIFTMYLLGGKPGVFIDVGCAHPRLGSNSKLLESRNWSGICIDVSKHSEWDRDRSTKCYCADATRIDYADFFRREHMPRVIDLLSIDVDDACFEVLKRIPFNDRQYKVVIIEHDAYRTSHLRKVERLFLRERGYDLVCSDVVHEPSKPFEDWWVHPSHFEASQINKIRSHAELDIEIIRKFGLQNVITRLAGFNGLYPQREIA